jgi:hypothetical protein
MTEGLISPAAPPTFEQRRHAQEQAVAADKPPAPPIPGYADMSFEQRRLAQDQRAHRAGR